MNIYFDACGCKQRKQKDDSIVLLQYCKTHQEGSDISEANLQKKRKEIEREAIILQYRRAKDEGEMKALGLLE